MTCPVQDGVILFTARAVPKRQVRVMARREVGQMLEPNERHFP